MNAISLYVSTSRIVFQSDGNVDQNWTDLCRLVPYLRQSLSCSVCGHLLIEPCTPANVHCQHHVCKQCISGRKNLKPACAACRNYNQYRENTQLRILLQCYKSLCKHIMTTSVYNSIQKEIRNILCSSDCGKMPNTLVDFIEEGAKFEDNFNSNSGLKKSEYSALPCVFPVLPQISSISKNMNKLSTKEQKQNSMLAVKPSTAKLSTSMQLPPIKTVSNGSAMYSVLYTGTGNKITIKRKTETDRDCELNKYAVDTVRTKVASKRRGCRCGNATAAPGKLTCCGQRCPCYVESKSCTECKCRGCRNPHRPDGGKIRPHIPELACYEIQVAEDNMNFPTSSVLAANSSDSRNKVPLHDFNTANGLSAAASVVITTPQTTRNHITDNNARESTSIENLTGESLLISSSEGSFQFVNVFTPSNKPQRSIESSQRLNSGQLTDVTLPQIIMQRDSSNVFVQQNELSNSSALFLTPNSSPAITLSPIIVTSSNSFPCQVLNEGDSSTASCLLNSSNPPPLVDLLVSEVNPIISDNILH